MKIRKIILLFFIIVFVYSCYKITTTVYEYNVGQGEYKKIQEISNTPSKEEVKIAPNNIKINDKNKNNSPVSESAIELSNELLQDQPAFKTADVFYRLGLINKDILGWINIPGTSIDYPIVQGKDNKYYLTRMFDKKSSICGSIFLDYRNNENLEDQNNIIYGHNMKDKSMFHNLVLYKSQDFFNDHQKIYISLPKGSRVCTIFSVYITDTKFIYNTPVTSNEKYKKFLKTIKNKSIFKNNVIPTVNDKIITLSTCTYEFKNARLVIHALIQK